MVGHEADYVISNMTTVIFLHYLVVLHHDSVPSSIDVNRHIDQTELIGLFVLGWI